MQFYSILLPFRLLKLGTDTFFQSLIKHYAIVTHRGLEIQLSTLFTLKLNGGEWPTSLDMRVVGPRRQYGRRR